LQKSRKIIFFTNPAVNAMEHTPRAKKPWVLKNYAGEMEFHDAAGLIPAFRAWL
jgi:hypothetical protein